MVSSGHPLATDAGLQILRAGGNAFDAAVAVAAALNVVEPAMSGAGGYGTIMVYSAASRETWFLNSSGRIGQLRRVSGALARLCPKPTRREVSIDARQRPCVGGNVQAVREDGVGTPVRTGDSTRQ